MRKDRVRATTAAAATLVLAVLPFILKRVRAHREPDKQTAPVEEKPFDVVDEASKESFPASDPPAY